MNEAFLVAFVLGLEHDDATVVQCHTEVVLWNGEGVRVGVVGGRRCDLIYGFDVEEADARNRWNVSLDDVLCRPLQAPCAATV